MCELLADLQSGCKHDGELKRLLPLAVVSNTVMDVRAAHVGT